MKLTDGQRAAKMIRAWSAFVNKADNPRACELCPANIAYCLDGGSCSQSFARALGIPDLEAFLKRLESNAVAEAAYAMWISLNSETYDGKDDVEFEQLEAALKEAGYKTEENR